MSLNQDMIKAYYVVITIGIIYLAIAFIMG
jgi:hypothetical protein